MNDRPIVFVSSTIRALISGRKQQTRRLMWGKPRATQQGHGERPSAMFVATDDLGRSALRYRPATIWHEITAGDRLWVKEAFATGGSAQSPIVYRADIANAEGMAWRPSLHLPRRQSRLTLIVTEVRRERVQQITREDAIAEGVQWDKGGRRWHFDGALADRRDPRRVFEKFWRELHGDEGWDADPEVAVITFTVLTANIDAAA